MAERVTSNTLIIIFAAVIVIFSIIILIQQAEANLMFWVLRPSDTTALDIVSNFNALSGTTGRITTEYRNITNDINYYIKNKDKIVCVIALKQEAQSSALKTINCYSTSKPVNIPELTGDDAFLLCIQKDYDANTNRLIVNSWWCPIEKKCGNVGQCN